MTRNLALALSTLAGFVDAIGFLSLGGFYVAFMSGNSTLLSLGMAAGAEQRTEVAAGLVGSFVVGVALGTLLGHPMGRFRPAGMLLSVGALLAVAWALDHVAWPLSAGFMLALSMGLENTVFLKNGVSGIGLTYMTGTLVRLGQRLGEAVMGGPWRALVPDFLLWSGMLIGAVLGALAFRRVGHDALWAGVAACVVMAAGAAWDCRAKPEEVQNA